MRPNTPQKNRVLANHSRKSGESVMNWFSGTLIVHYLDGEVEQFSNISYTEAIQLLKNIQNKDKREISNNQYLPAPTTIHI